MIPPRTGTTVLSDDELLLMDFLFRSWVGERFLRREEYPIHMNVRYTHGLDDDALSRTLRRSVDTGIFACEGLQDERRYSLTPQGGAMWEAERKPSWSHYCQSGFRYTPSHGQRVRLFSPELDTIERFLSIAEQTSYYNDLPRRRRHRELSSYSLLPWKIFPTVHVVLLSLPKQPWPPTTDWKRMEEGRTWWGHVSELVALQQKAG